MLVISRRIGESFLIGDDIEATVVDITGEKVVLGISAPRSVPISRIDSPEGRSGDGSKEPGAGSEKINIQSFSRTYRTRRAGRDQSES